MRAIRFNKYSVWFAVNFIVGLFPFLLFVLIEEGFGHNSFSNFLTFGFTLILSSVYIFSNQKKEPIFKDTIIVLSSIIGVLVLVFFILYSVKSPDHVYLWITKNYSVTFTISILVFLFVSFMLNYRTIEEQVKYSNQKKKFEDSEETKKRFEAYMSKQQGERS